MKTKIKLLALIAGLMSVLPMTSAWAYSTTFYAKLTAKVATDSTGLGKVYVQSETPNGLTAPQAMVTPKTETVTLVQPMDGDKGFIKVNAARNQ